MGHWPGLVTAGRPVSPLPTLLAWSARCHRAALVSLMRARPAPLATLIPPRADTGQGGMGRKVTRCWCRGHSQQVRDLPAGLSAWPTAALRSSEARGCHLSWQREQAWHAGANQGQHTPALHRLLSLQDRGQPCTGAREAPGLGLGLGFWFCSRPAAGLSVAWGRSLPPQLPPSAFK